MRRQQLFSLMALTFCAACLLAANQQALPEGWPILANYGYWIIRLSIQATLFLAFLQLVNLFPMRRSRLFSRLCLACLASYLPFVLSVTAMDIVLGFPELGAAVGVTWVPNTRFSAFLLELGYLLDNHLFFCALIATPLLLRPEDALTQKKPMLSEAVQPETPVTGTSASASSGQQPFFDSLTPPFSGPLIRAEAQEHYVKLVGAEETRMILYRFSDVLRELPDALGMQVHRSHWIAKDAIENVYRKGNSTRIVTRDGSEIPVSRRYAGHVSRWQDSSTRPTSPADLKSA